MAASPRIAWAVLLIVLVACGASASRPRPHEHDAPPQSCSPAVEALGFFAETMSNCSAHPSQYPICAQLSAGAFWRPPRTNLLYLLEPYLLRHGLAWLSDSLSDVDLMLSAQLNGGGSAASRAASPGEMAVVLDRICGAWAKLLPNESASVATSAFWEVWTAEWSKAALRVLSAERWSLLRASNYMFIGAQPYPLTAAAQKAMALAHDLLFRHLAASADLGVLAFVPVSIPYTTDNGSAVTLPGVAVSPAPSALRSASPPQLVVATSGGLDWPLPGEAVRSLYTYLDEGYAVMYYEGPGQVRARTYTHLHTSIHLCTPPHHTVLHRNTSPHAWLIDSRGAGPHSGGPAVAAPLHAQLGPRADRRRDLRAGQPVAALG